jgi:hypothetical protein
LQWTFEIEVQLQSIGSKSMGKEELCGKPRRIQKLPLEAIGGPT